MQVIMTETTLNLSSEEPITVATTYKKSGRQTRNNSKTYKLFQLLELPCVTRICDEFGHFNISPAEFIDLCLTNAQQRNHQNLMARQQRSSDYFTSLNHADRYRVPLAIRRFNNGFHEQHYGLMSFIVQRGETVKNKVFNQRVSSINAELLEKSRISEIIYPTGYQLHHPLDLSSVGRVIDVADEGFNVVRVNEEWLM
jgi:hypothetical protein